MHYNANNMEALVNILRNFTKGDSTFDRTIEIWDGRIVKCVRSILPEDMVGTNGLNYSYTKELVEDGRSFNLRFSTKERSYDISCSIEGRDAFAKKLIKTLISKVNGDLQDSEFREYVRQALPADC